MSKVECSSCGIKKHQDRDNFRYKKSTGKWYSKCKKCEDIARNKDNGFIPVYRGNNYKATNGSIVISGLEANVKKNGGYE